MGGGQKLYNQYKPMNTQIPTVSFDAVKVGDNLVRVDVILKNAPENLFGAAFHLKAGGVVWYLKSYEKGDLFATEGLAPLMLAEEKTVTGGDKEIVFGVSLRRTDVINIRDGTLASFYLQTEGEGSLKLDFTDAHLSIIGLVRTDVENAKWEAKTINLVDLRIREPFQETGLQQGPPLREGQDSFYNIELTAVYTVMVVCLLVCITGVAAYLLLKRWKRVKS